MITPPDNSLNYKSAEGYQKVLSHYDATFQRMGVPYDSTYVETLFGLTHAVISGNEEGNPIVLWHGQNANAASWASWIPALAPTYRLYAIDVIGGMGKSAPNRPSKKGTAYGQWAAEAMSGLGLKQANMIGASQGGWLIIKLANVAPGKIGSAVLMSSAGLLRLDMIAALRLIPRIVFKQPAEAAREMMAVVSPLDLPPDPFYLEFFELMIKHFRSESLVPILDDKEIRQLTAPTAMLMGQHETSFNPYKALRRGLRLLPNVAVAEIVPGVGHAMIHRQPDWVIGRVKRFFEQYAV